MGEVVTLHDHFWAAYEQLSASGWCDGAGGAEYDRVREEWEKAGRPEDVDAFIRRRANVGPFDVKRDHCVECEDPAEQGAYCGSHFAARLARFRAEIRDGRMAHCQRCGALWRASTTPPHDCVPLDPEVLN
jgi:hypothetical protein